MTRFQLIKEGIDYIEQHLENIENGYDATDYSFVIKYKDGTIKYINEYDVDDGINLNPYKIAYMVIQDPADAWDTEGKMWSRDFAGDLDDLDGDSVDAWNEYVDKMLYS